MKLWCPLPLRGLFLLACAGMAVPRSRGEETSLPLLELGAIQGTGAAAERMLEVAKIMEVAERDHDWRKGMSALATVAREAKRWEDNPARLGAELAWVRLASREGGEEVDLDDALEDLVTRARDWNLGIQEAAVYSFWAERLEGQGEWLMALRALDGGSQALLGEGSVNQALHFLLKMSRLCRENGHPWRLQEVWIRIAQVERELPESIVPGTRKLLALERGRAAPLLETLPAAEPVPARVEIQPSQTAVIVSSPHGEVGRGRFFLTNETTRTVQGTLEVTARTGVVNKWETGRSGHWITLGEPLPAGSQPSPAASKKTLTLRPGERLNVYVEREQAAAEDSVNLTWTGPDGTAEGKGEFLFSSRQPKTSVVNSGGFTARPGWSVPLYHEINYRGTGTKLEDFQFQANIPCRLEIFDMDGGRHPSVDAGRLLAVDTDGDGCFTGPGDIVNADQNANGSPDILIGDRSRSLEIQVWPLIPIPKDAAITVSARLLRGEQEGMWRTDAQDTVHPSGETAPKTASASKTESSKIYK